MVERQTQAAERRAGPFWLNLITVSTTVNVKTATSLSLQFTDFQYVITNTHTDDGWPENTMPSVANCRRKHKNHIENVDHPANFHSQKLVIENKFFYLPVDIRVTETA